MNVQDEVSSRASFPRPVSRLSTISRGVTASVLTRSRPCSMP